MKSLLLRKERIKWLLVVHISKQKEPEGCFFPCFKYNSSPPNFLRKIREKVHRQQKLVKR